MFVIIAIDALEYDLVEEFDCKNLKQDYFGKTDISEFSEPRTMVLWSSFMTGMNKETEVLGEGNKEMWNKTWKTEETFFSKFKNPKVIDLPGYSYDLEAHQNSRRLLRNFFEAKSAEEKESVKKAYNRDAFEHHEKIKKEFEKAMQEDHDFILVYFSAIDVIGHLNFGNKTMMRMLYKEMDELVKSMKEKLKYDILVISDHGMKPLGNFGDHSGYGFWSANFKTDMKNPKITDFYSIFSGV